MGSNAHFPFVVEVSGISQRGQDDEEEEEQEQGHGQGHSPESALIGKSTTTTTTSWSHGTAAAVSNHTGVSRSQLGSNAIGRLIDAHADAEDKHATELQSRDRRIARLMHERLGLEIAVLRLRQEMDEMDEMASQSAKDITGEEARARARIVSHVRAKAVADTALALPGIGINTYGYERSKDAEGSTADAGRGQARRPRGVRLSWPLAQAALEDLKRASILVPGRMSIDGDVSVSMTGDGMSQPISLLLADTAGGGEGEREGVLRLGHMTRGGVSWQGIEDEEPSEVLRARQDFENSRELQVPEDPVDGHEDEDADKSVDEDEDGPSNEDALIVDSRGIQGMVGDAVESSTLDRKSQLLPPIRTGAPVCDELQE